MKKNLEESIKKLEEYVRVFQWWSNHLAIPLKNGEYTLFNVIIDNMKKVIEKIKKEEI